MVNDIGRSEDGRFVAEGVVDEITAAGGQAIASVGSVATDEGAGSIVADAISAYGELHGVVNNAGIVNGGPFQEQTADQFRVMLDVHVVGAFLMAREAWPYLVRNSGSLVNVASNVGFFGLENMASYAAAKGGVSGLSRVLAREGEGRVRVNSLTPMADTNPGRTAAAEQMFAGMSERSGPEWVTPLLLHLLDPGCTAHGGVFSAVGGRYARIDSVVGDGWLAPGRIPPSESEVQDHWGVIADLSPHHELDSMKGEVTLVKQALDVAVGRR